MSQELLQETFDKVCNHLMKQMKQAKSPIDGTCMLRTQWGLKCAVGGLIPDDWPLSEDQVGLGVDGIRASHEPELQKLAEFLHLDDPAMKRMLSDLQELHDHCDPEGWAEQLRKTAAYRNFTLPSCIERPNS